MDKRRIAGFEVSAIGLGCMSLSHSYGPPPPRDQAERVLKGALDAGYTFLDTASNSSQEFDFMVKSES